MDLNDFITTGRGLMLRGSDPDRLDDLLVQYEALQQRAGFEPAERLAPGRSRAEIVDTWASRGVTVTEEAVRLWMWHDGTVPYSGYAGAWPTSLQEAAARYDREEKGEEDWEWGPNWVPVWGNGTIAMNSNGEQPPEVRDSDGARGASSWDTRVQALSLCTMLALTLYGEEHGLYTFDEHGRPDTSRELWPPELEISKLYGW